MPGETVRDFLACLPEKDVFAVFTHSRYFRLIPVAVRQPYIWHQDVVDRSRTDLFSKAQAQTYYLGTL